MICAFFLAPPKNLLFRNSPTAEPCIFERLRCGGRSFIFIKQGRQAETSRKYRLRGGFAWLLLPYADSSLPEGAFRFVTEGMLYNPFASLRLSPPLTQGRLFPPPPFRRHAAALLSAPLFVQSPQKMRPIFYTVAEGKMAKALAKTRKKW